MRIAVSKAEQDCRDVFEELVRLGILPEPPEDIMFLYNPNSKLPPVGLPKKLPGNRRLPLQSNKRFVALPRRPSPKRRSSIFKKSSTV